ncbi:MAG: SLATT domain-containing protein [Eubacteriaceae bacterium]|nr:SLATT domain-containing protein [Eubacteriaceae bacterium]
MSLLLDFANTKKNIFDMLASMHFKLSDNYNKWNIFFDCIEILIAVLLCGTTFLDISKIFIFNNLNLRIIISFISILLFAFTLIKQRLDFKRRSEYHKIAGKLYVNAKNDLSQNMNIWRNSNTEDTNIMEYINNTYKNLNELIQIPESKFHKLKHYHQYKVEFSKFLDNNKTKPWLLCKILFFFNIKFK